MTKNSLMNAQDNLLLGQLGLDLSTHQQMQLRDQETRWHYSQHFLAEKQGEAVIEDMLLLATHKRQRALLSSQLVDEKHHTHIFSAQVDRIGLEPRAHRYADGYAKLVKDQKTFTEKVFVFQILTEAISAAYCQWRLNHIHDSDLNKIDIEVGTDEKRHLVMGKTLLSICDPDELGEVLTPRRQQELIKEMNQLCEKAVRLDMIESLATPYLKDNQPLSCGPTHLDKDIARAVLQEYRKLKQTLLKTDKIETAYPAR